MLLATLMTIISCGSKKELTTPEVTETVEASKEMIEGPMIVLSKGGCFGSCPVYTFSITESGDMTFEGIRDTKKLGTFSKQLDLATLQSLVSSFKEYKFMELDDFYESRVLDAPSITISYTNNDATKTVVGKSERPERVHRIQKQLEEIAEDNYGWTLIEAPKDTINEDELIKSEIIITTKGGPSLSKWFDQMRVDHGIRIVKRLSAANNTWLISYNTNNYAPEEMLDLLRKNDFIRSAEFNSETSNR
ncbi:DUF6438 domain-containing protein [Saprospiraceae bacterium]|nr:DUF6438 domain-containing protein [Saprospiraceae bacterium]